MAIYIKMNNESLNLRDSSIFLNCWTHPSDLLTFYTLSYKTQVLNENARKPLSIGYLAFSLCSDILAALSVF